MPAGRPTKLDSTLIEKAQAWLKERTEDRIALPTVEGLSLHLGISRDTVYAWCEPLEPKPDDVKEVVNGQLIFKKTYLTKLEMHARFSDIVSDLKSAQAEKLLQLGLKGTYNATIAKLILSGKHGYVEKSQQDITSDGKAVSPVLVKFVGEDPQPKA